MKGKRNLCRALSMLLTVAMVFSLCVQGVFVSASTVYAQSEDGKNQYTSIESAWSAAKSGVVVKMMADWKLSDRLVLNKGESATIDMNGLRIDRQRSSYTSDGEVIYLDEGASLTLKSTVTTTTHDFTGWEDGSRKSLKVKSGGLVTGGWSSNGAGGVHMKASAVLTLDNVAIAGNCAEVTWWQDGYGGGVMMDGNDCKLTMKNGATIAYNYCQDEGGGVYSNGKSTVIEMSDNSSISYNTAKDEGGGVYFCYSSFRISGDSTAEVSNNKAKNGNGGGIFTEQCQTSTNSGTISGLIMEKNTCTNYGGAIYLHQENTAVSNCVIKENTAKEGGGIYNNNDNNQINKCTITDNTASHEGGGVYTSCQNDIRLSGKVIIKNNKRTDGAKDDLFLNNTSASAAYIISRPSADSEVGLRMAGNSRKVGEGCFFYTSAFFSDIAGYHIELKTDEEDPELWVVEGEEKAVETKTVTIENASKVVGTYNGKDLLQNYFIYESTNHTGIYYYSDGYFINGKDSNGGDPTIYNEHLATMSFSLVMSGFPANITATTDEEKYMGLDYTYKSQNVRQMLTNIGVAESDIYISESYAVKPGSFTIGVAIGSKTITDQDGNESTLVPIVIRSGNYESEWISNATIGENGEATGFASAAEQVMNLLTMYIDDYGLTDAVSNGTVKFWIVGYSRGGATANLTAKRIVEQYCDGTSLSSSNQIYAYTFEAPQGGVNSEMKLDETAYYCIHNVINQADAVPELAPDEMGCMRYGVDHYVPGEAKAGTVESDDYMWCELTVEGYKTWSDNEAYAVGTDAYKAQRKLMLQQLYSVDPTTVFYDHFAIARFDYINIPILSTTVVSVDGASITQAEFIRILLRAVQDWGLPDGRSMRGNYSENYYHHSVIDEFVYYASVQSVMQTLISLVYDGTNRLNILMDYLDAAKDALGYEKLLFFYSDAVGNWQELPDWHRESITRQVWDALMYTEKNGKTAASYFSKEELAQLSACWYTLVDVAMRFISGDYNTAIEDWDDTTSSYGYKMDLVDGYTQNLSSYGNDHQVFLGTLIYNVSALAQAHATEVNFAWVRSYDSFYENEGNVYAQLDTTNAATPVVTSSVKGGVLTMSVADAQGNALPGASMFYRTYDLTDGFSDWKPYNNRAVTLDLDVKCVQTTACYYTKKAAVETITVTPPTTVSVNGEMVGRFEPGEIVTVDGTSTDIEKVFKAWDASDGVTLANENSAVTTFTMPDESVSLTATYLTRISSMKLTVGMPVAGAELPGTGMLTWTAEDGGTRTKEVPVYWLEQVNDKTQTASGTAKYGTLYSVAALVEQDLDDDMAFSFNLTKDNATIVYEDTVQETVRAYTDDAGSLRIYGGQVETERATVAEIPGVTISVAEGSDLAALKAALPTSATVVLNDGSATELALDLQSANTDGAMDGDTVKDGTVTIPVKGTTSVDAADKMLTVTVCVTEEAVDVPISTTEEAGGEPAAASMLRTLFALESDVQGVDTEPGTYQTTSLNVVLTTETEGATIYYKLDNGPEQVYSGSGITLTGADGDKTTHVIATWAVKDGSRSSDAVYTYILDNPFTVTIHGRDTGLKGIAQNQELWETPKTYTYYKGTTVTIAAPAEQDEVFAKWDTTNASGIRVSDETALSMTVESIAGDIELTAIYNPVIKELDLTIDAPEDGKTLATKVTGAVVTVTNPYEMTSYFKEIQWSPDSKAAVSGTAYTAKLEMDFSKIIEAAKEVDPENGAEKARELKYFLSENLVINVNDGDKAIKASVSKTNDAVYVTFPAVNAQQSGELASVEMLAAVSVPYSSAKSGVWNLPETTTLYLTNGSTVEAQIVWNGQPTFQKDVMTYSVAGNVILPDTVKNPNGISTEVTVQIVLGMSDTTNLVYALHATVESGTYQNTQYVRLISDDAEATVYYTLDGSTPTATSTRYQENTTIVISPSATLNAIAVKNGVASAVVSYSYIIQPAGDDSTKKPIVVPSTQQDETAADYASCKKDSSCVLSQFTDVASSAWYHDGVHYCLDRGLMQGVSTTKFAPNADMTRAQLVTILWRMAGEPGADAAIRFQDVASGTWYTEAVRWAASTGVVSGITESTFAPNDAVTREQLASILYRYAESTGMDMSAGKNTSLAGYEDASSISAYAVSAMQWAVGEGIISGTGSRTLSPQGTATRAQCAAMIQRFCEKNQ